MLIAHASDVHLDSPMVGLDAYEGCPREALRGATRRALENLVRVSIDDGAALLLIAGDLYDGSWKDHQTGLYFVSQMRRLREAGVRVVVLRGNHDAESEIGKRIVLPDNVRELSTSAPETVVFEDLGVAVHGQGFWTRDVRDDLARSYPEPRRGLFNVGMLHTALSGRPGHEPYAPTSLSTLLDRGYDYWALGHVHKHEVLHEDPTVVFPGNLQGRHILETGPKGAYFFEVEQGRLVSGALRPLDHARFYDCVVKAEERDAVDDVLERFRGAVLAAAAGAEGRLLAMRATITGFTRSHRQILRERDQFVADLRAVVIDTVGDAAWLGDVRVDVRAPLDLHALARANDPLGHLLRAIDRVAADPAALTELAELFAELGTKLPRGLRDEPELRFLEDPSELVPLLDDVKQLLVSRLLPAAED
jgi:DNA repair exonuclease SbcCD nuclease subunit